jgi:hypothetical protein
MDASAAAAEAMPASVGDAGENTTPGAARAEGEEEVGEEAALEADEALALARALGAELEVRVFCACACCRGLAGVGAVALWCHHPGR